MDPEDVGAPPPTTRTPLRARALRRHGGEVHRRRRDGAVRGAGRARGRSRARRTRRARDTRLAAEDGLEVRIGITTGEALVQLDAQRGGRRMASGDVVNTAARLQSGGPRQRHPRGRADIPRDRARSNSARPSRSRRRGRRAGRGLGGEEPRSRLGVDVAQDRAQLVGRERELELVREPSCAPGRARAAARDARRRSRDRQVPPRLRAFSGSSTGGRAHHWRQGRSLPYGDGVTLWALGEIVKAQAGILEKRLAKRSRRSSRSCPRTLRHGRGGLGRSAAPRPLGLGEEAEHGGTTVERGLRRLAALPRGVADNARSCSSSRTSTGPTRPSRFRRRARRWATGVPLLVVCDRAAGAARAAARMGRRQAERHDARSLAVL